ncbi:LacI family DNA-binding transcriptional regulator [Phycicoccus flavus]|uniref:LacI family DNA-binding transcriptional regulator n=1 Tax=Phycicoccus flavus TaxID=2502783 RepID=UPI000FEBE778|nr:LacI family DNA-binding transcriptional regulator [Phycicoccus flavus]NHA66454.1 LacI family DNA-binding transcriptional regulator [Phycicoccus flavus]
MRRRTPSIHDVAKVAGVSAQTVSRVLNEHPNVSDRTRSLVTSAMTELGYRPNHAARSLRGGSRLIGVLSSRTSFFGPSAALYGVEAAAADAGYEVVVVNLASTSPGAVRAACERLLSLGVAGVVAVLPLEADGELLSPLLDAVPTVLLQGSRAPSPLPLVGVDNEGGARQATRHLLDLGHETVWHVAGPRDWPDAVAREDGWRSALEAAGVEAPPTLHGTWDGASGYEAGRILARMEELTAVFAANDQMALGVLLALAESGRDVPGEVSVVGFDDIPEAAFFRPPLTTVRQDLTEVGRRCLETVLTRITDADAALPAATVVTADLVVRASSGPRRDG